MSKLLNIKTRQEVVNKCFKTMYTLASRDDLFCDDNKIDHKESIRESLVRSYMTVMDHENVKIIVREIHNSGVKAYNTTNTDTILGDWISPLEMNLTLYKELRLFIYCLHQNPVMFYDFYGILEDIFNKPNEVEELVHEYLADIEITYQYPNASSKRLDIARKMAGFGQLYNELKPRLRSYVSLCINRKKVRKDPCVISIDTTSKKQQRLNLG